MKELLSIPLLCSFSCQTKAFKDAAKSLQSCPTLCYPIDGSPPGSPIPGILQARTLEWVAISFSNAWKWKVKVKMLSHVWLFVTPWTAAHQAPPSMGFSRQEYWSGVPLPSLHSRIMSCLIFHSFPQPPNATIVNTLQIHKFVATSRNWNWFLKRNKMEVQYYWKVMLLVWESLLLTRVSNTIFPNALTLCSPGQLKTLKS